MKLFWALLPLWLIPLLFVGTIAISGRPLWRSHLPNEPHLARCNWDCHNHGCTHPSRLPPFFVSDRGLFGQTIHLLYRGGDILVPGRRGVGYGAANVLIFCLVWPALMYGLFLVALRQHLILKSRS